MVNMLNEHPASFSAGRYGDTEISLSNSWHLLGPFPVGTRETAWPTDPLDAYNGFSNITYDPDAAFTSALAPNGHVRWATLNADQLIRTSGYARAELTVEFPNIDWSFLRSIYGWAALQYQAFARGDLAIVGPRMVTVSISTPGLLEVWVDNKSYFGGDLYSYGKSPLILTLEPGVHVIELRFVRDVRAFGGESEPRIKGVLEVMQMAGELIVDPESILVAEKVEGKLASPLASVTVRNAMNAWLQVVSIEGGEQASFDLTLLPGPVTVAPFQTRPVAFRIENLPGEQMWFSYQLTYKMQGEAVVKMTKPHNVDIRGRSMDETQKFTFLHPSGIVSYAIIKPPVSHECCVGGEQNLPVLLGLHGAGLEADSGLVRHMLDDAYGIRAWTIFPTGVTPWSGDDWHSWAHADLQAAVSAIPNWMIEVGWNGPGVAQNDWIVSGHSNGGQGTWFLLSHQPDRVIAAAPVSGYSSIGNYVPYTLWQNSEASFAHVRNVARQSFKHELLVSNFAGIPIHQQHGSADDNVPVYHSRLMHQLIRESGWHSAYDELPGKGHWFDGVLTTEPLLTFYNRHAKHVNGDILPAEFSIIVPSDASMGSRGGLFVDQLQSPDCYGRIHVVRDPNATVWRLTTSNIHRFHLIPSAVRGPSPKAIFIDGTDPSFEAPADGSDSAWFVVNPSGKWEVTRDASWQSLAQRYGRQIGTVDAILHTLGSFMIVSASRAVDDVALQISRNFFQYFSADSQLLQPGANSPQPLQDEMLSIHPGNIITVALGDQLQPSQLGGYPIRVEDNRLLLTRPSCNIHSSDAAEHSYPFEKNPGAIFLRPLPNERLELVVWGANHTSLQRAARLVPMLTGTGQPDFVLICTHSRSQSGARSGKTEVSEVCAAGFFDYAWRVSMRSYTT